MSEELVKDAWYFMRHIPGGGGSQPNRSFEQERAMGSLSISHSTRGIWLPPRLTLIGKEVFLEDCPIRHIPLAVHVPMNPERSVPEGVFAGVPRLRHVSAESGIRFIKAEAWQNCRQLRIVKLPATVVGISFRDCKLLNSVAAPGCLDFGYKAFAECCSLQWVYASEGIANVFNSEAKLGQYLRTLWLKASRLKLAAKAIELGGSRRLLKEKKFSPGRCA